MRSFLGVSLSSSISTRCRKYSPCESLRVTLHAEQSMHSNAMVNIFIPLISLVFSVYADWDSSYLSADLSALYSKPHTRLPTRSIGQTTTTQICFKNTNISIDKQIIFPLTCGNGPICEGEILISHFFCVILRCKYGVHQSVGASINK